MNHNPRYNELRELSWRRKLNEAEEAELRALLAGDAEGRMDWQTEAGLNELLTQVSNVPVPSNFTSRVLQAVEQETKKAPTQGWRFWHRLPRWLPRVAVVGIVLAFGTFAYQRHQTLETARSVAHISLPEPELLRDFDAIQRLGQTQAPDEDLLALLK